MSIQYLGVCDCANGTRQLIWVGSVFDEDTCEMYSKDFNSRSDAEAWVLSQTSIYIHTEFACGKVVISTTSSSEFKEVVALLEALDLPHTTSIDTMNSEVIKGASLLEEYSHECINEQILELEESHYL